MKPLLPILAAAALLVPPAAPADPAYRCLRDGKTVFTDEPGPDCQPLDLKVIQPDPQELARLQEKKRLEEELEREDQERLDRERAIRAQERSARAAERQAELQRRLLDQQAQQSQRDDSRSYYPGGWPYGYGYGYPVRPIGPRPPVVTPPSRPAPGYPYGPEQIGVGGGRGR
jgi:hypothetical protein